MRRLDLSRFILPGLLLIPAIAVAQEDCKPLTEGKKLPALTTLGSETNRLNSSADWALLRD
jgi:hypothetical protein